MAQGLETIFAHSKYEAAKVSGGLKTSLSWSTSGSQ